MKRKLKNKIYRSDRFLNKMMRMTKEGVDTRIAVLTALEEIHEEDKQDKQFDKFCKMIDSIPETEVYEGSCNCDEPECQHIGKCDCDQHEHQVCDTCQGTDGEDINQGHYFEIMDRTHIIQCSIDDFIYEHPAMTKKMKKKISKVQDLLCEVYQWSAGEWDNFDE